MSYIVIASKMQAELSKMRAIVDACPNPKNQTRVNNLLTGYYTIDHIELEYMQLVSRVFYHRKHCSIFINLKRYNTTRFDQSIGNVVGVFQSDQYIIKYDTYNCLRQLAAYKKLGFGINRNVDSAATTATTNENSDGAIDTNDKSGTATDITYCANIITPIWYCIYALNDQINNDDDDHDDDHNDDDHNDDDDNDAITDKPVESESVESSDPIDANSTKSMVPIANLMTLEVQPKLHNSISFHKWYNSACISMRDHDYVITKIMLSVAKSIQFCHAKNLVHGDIKPDNFIVECCDPSQQPRRASSEDKMIRRGNVPTVFLIDFGLCGTHGTDSGTGGTRPFCAPETTNINNFTRSLGAAPATVSSEDDYVWCTLSKSHDVWSFGLILFTIITYNTIFHYYKHYPFRVFDKHGYVRDEVLTGDPEISEHPLYRVFMKTLCPPDKRASIDEIIDLMSVALLNL